MMINCPRCQIETSWQDNPHRPFCSERCKLIDLGAWANEEYYLPTQDVLSTEQNIDFME